MANPVVGNNVGIQAHPASFVVLEKKFVGVSDDNMEIYSMKVEFGDPGSGKIAEVVSESKSLKKAFQMLEMVGKQPKTMTTKDEFDTFLKSVDGKKIWFHIEKQRGGSQGNTVTAYKAESHNNTLVDAFKRSKGHNPIHTIDSTVSNYLKLYANIHKAELDPSRMATKKDLRFHVRKRHPSNSSPSQPSVRGTSNPETFDF